MECGCGVCPESGWDRGVRSVNDLWMVGRMGVVGKGFVDSGGVEQRLGDVRVEVFVMRGGVVEGVGLGGGGDGGVGMIGVCGVEGWLKDEWIVGAGG
ncbi:hypothetical protein Tco_0617937 [Tanacetum coccineum]